MMRTSINTNSEEDLVARLTPDAAKLLLRLLLSQGREDTQATQQEFAILYPGFPRWSISLSLYELEQSGLIEIIALPPNISIVCKLRICTQESSQNAHTPEASIQEDVQPTDSEVDTPPDPRATERDVLPAPTNKGPGTAPEDTRGLNEVRTAKAGPHAPGSGKKDFLEQNGVVADAALSAGIPPGQDDVRRGGQEGPGLLGACRLADESGMRQKQVRALRAVWDDVFPEAEYPFQRLTEDGARRLLAGGRTAEGVGSAIVDAVSSTRERIQAPRAFVEAVLKNRDRKQPNSDDEHDAVITDGLRRLAELGRKQYGTTHSA